MDRRTLTTAVKAVGGYIVDKDRRWTCYSIPSSKEDWFYDLRDRIPFCNLAYGSGGDRPQNQFYFGVFWDNPK